MSMKSVQTHKPNRSDVKEGHGSIAATVHSGYLKNGNVDHINDATRHDEIFDTLDGMGYQKIASRLRYLYEVTQDKNPDDPVMEFMSLRELALFFISDNISLPHPQIGIDPDGFLQAEWYSHKGSALMAFLPDGSIQFAATLAKNKENKVQNIQGTGAKDFALYAIQSFIT